MIGSAPYGDSWGRGQVLYLIGYTEATLEWSQRRGQRVP